MSECPGKPDCIATHCRKCGECPLDNGFGALGHCEKCLVEGREQEEQKNERAET